MYLHIGPDRLVNEVQKEFNNMFPFLKIEFFQSRAAKPANLLQKNLISHNRKISEMHSVIADGAVEIMAEMKVRDLENIFKDRFGLSVQVFRHSGNLWLETTMTDNWTLRQQNEHGAEISSTTPQKNIPSADDYDLNRGEQH
jgi:hypothetical protein